MGLAECFEDDVYVYWGAYYMGVQDYRVRFEEQDAGKTWQFEI